MREMFEQASAFAKMPGKAFVFRETAAIHRHLYDDAEEAEYDTEDRCEAVHAQCVRSSSVCA